MRFSPQRDASVIFTIDETDSLNNFGRSQLTLDAATGEQIKWEKYSEQNAARQLRSWARFTHTGESFGITGQTIGFLACVGSTLLVVSGFALAVRRLRNWQIVKIKQL